MDRTRLVVGAVVLFFLAAVQVACCRTIPAAGATSVAKLAPVAAKRTLWEGVCWKDTDDDGIEELLLPSDGATHKPDPDCAGLPREAFSWPPDQQAPLGVSSAPELAPLVMAAVGWWNAWAGFAVYEYVAPGDKTDILVVQEPENDYYRGITSHYRKDGRELAYIGLAGLNDHTGMTLMHELGHALGLAHDSERDSVMYGGGVVAMGIQPEDIAAVRKLYYVHR